MVALDVPTWERFKSGMARFANESSARRPSILAIDPGKVSTGWAHAEEDGAIFGGQGKPDDVIDQIEARLAVTGAPWCFVREGLYSVSFASMVEQHVANEAKGKKRRAQISPESLYGMGWGAGYVEGGLRHVLGRPQIRWSPKPTSWRAVLKLNRRATSESTAREETQEAVIALARKHVGGDPGADFANAVGMLIATAVLLDDARGKPA